MWVSNERTSRSAGPCMYPPWGYRCRGHVHVPSGDGRGRAAAAVDVAPGSGSGCVGSVLVGPYWQCARRTSYGVCLWDYVASGLAARARLWECLVPSWGGESGRELATNVGDGSLRGTPRAWRGTLATQSPQQAHSTNAVPPTHCKRSRTNTLPTQPLPDPGATTPPPLPIAHHIYRQADAAKGVTTASYPRACRSIRPFVDIHTSDFPDTCATPIRKRTTQISSRSCCRQTDVRGMS